MPRNDQVTCPQPGRRAADRVDSRGLMLNEPTEALPPYPKHPRTLRRDLYALEKQVTTTRSQDE